MIEQIQFLEVLLQDIKDQEVNKKLKSLLLEEDFFWLEFQKIAEKSVQNYEFSTKACTNDQR